MQAYFERYACISASYKPQFTLTYTKQAMNKLSTQDRLAILNSLSEGMGINAAARITGKSKNTGMKLLIEAGEACAAYQDRVMVNLPCKRIQVDEIWSFVGAKQKNVRADDETHADYGDAYTFTAIDPDTNLMPGGARHILGYTFSSLFAYQVNIKEVHASRSGHPLN
jgi:hypothetical protein